MVRPSAAAAPRSKAALRAAKGGPTFILVPMAWIKRLRGASGAARDVADFLLVKRFSKTRGGKPPPSVSMSKAEAKELGYSPTRRDRALRELRKRGLIVPEPRRPEETASYALKFLK